MRTLLKNLAILLLLLFNLTAFAQRKPKIKGSRIVTEVNGELPMFNTVQLNDDLDIVLKKSFGPGYKIEADDNLIDILKFNVVDGTLIISSFYDVTAKKKLDITVEFTELQAIVVKEGSITSEDMINSDELFVDAFSNARLNLQASAAVMDIRMEETSRGDFNVDVDSLNISINQRAEAYVYAVNEVGLVDLEQNGSLTLEGTSDRIEANLTDNSRLKAERMETAAINAKLENSAVARLNVYRELELSAIDNTRTYLYGNPSITLIEFLNTAQLLKKEEQ
ncbi:GIN domain-containing protein [Flagellimonas algicola]|uniref:DUF2807 domain-containing protein n=1 Tax=Flagellimonas algicola TaxID=2583815 RepID=A0ABY2WIM5_9FLAO|nr:DUF2807 domain-containing protein [Allomuricauda algicola]TMU54382.1 DUF2807 domain-containing protein [Allomuricauda algicola]